MTLTDDETKRLYGMGGPCEHWVVRSRYLTPDEVADEADACISELLELMSDEAKMWEAKAEGWKAAAENWQGFAEKWKDGTISLQGEVTRWKNTAKKLEDEAEEKLKQAQAEAAKWKALADERWEQCKHEAAMREEAEAALAECRRRRERDREEALRARGILEAADAAP